MEFSCVKATQRDIVQGLNARCQYTKPFHSICYYINMLGTLYRLYKKKNDANASQFVCVKVVRIVCILSWVWKYFSYRVLKCTLHPTRSISLCTLVHTFWRHGRVTFEWCSFVFFSLVKIVSDAVPCRIARRPKRKYMYSLRGNRTTNAWRACSMYHVVHMFVGISTALAEGLCVLLCICLQYVRMGR